MRDDDNDNDDDNFDNNQKDGNHYYVYISQRKFSAGGRVHFQG